MRPDLDSYRQAVAAKRLRFAPRGLAVLPPLCPALMPVQRAGVEFALKAGTSALFYDTGLGKTLMELEWGRVIAEHTGKPTVLHCPLAVAGQHADEARKFGIAAKVARDPADIDPDTRVALINYEIAEKFDPALFGGVGLDESSILKSFTGATTRMLTARYRDTPFRLCGTATPAPNDHTELGTHAEFLGVMRRDEMLSRWFLHDSMNTKDWRLKRHAANDFWEWVASFARCVERPSDLGFLDDGYVLPSIEVFDHTVRADIAAEVGTEKKTGQHMLFRMPEMSATSIHREKRLSLAARAELAFELVRGEFDEPWVIWVETDAEEQAMSARLKEAVTVRGSMPPGVKERKLRAFSAGEINHMITKPSIAGFGLNWQHCARQIFVGLSFSYEMYYQAIRRCWRFGQKRPVEIHVIGADTERAIRQAILRKQGDHEAMKAQMRAAMRRVAMSYQAVDTYDPQQEARLPAWLAA